MIRIENIEVIGWAAAIRGMRNPMNSWDKSDTTFCKHPDETCSVCEYRHTDQCADGFVIGANDYDLMKRLVGAGSDHRKFLRMINVTMDITAPLYWWKEYDTYKVGTVADSCSTMHKIDDKVFTFDDFSCEHMSGTAEVVLQTIIDLLNLNRELYRKSGKKDKTAWWNMIQLLPTSYNQKRTVQLNYEVLRNIYHARLNHKLDEWRELCGVIARDLPYSILITMKEATYMTFVNESEDENNE